MSVKSAIYAFINYTVLKSQIRNWKLSSTSFFKPFQNNRTANCWLNAHFTLFVDAIWLIFEFCKSFKKNNFTNVQSVLNSNTIWNETRTILQKNSTLHYKRSNKYHIMWFSIKRKQGYNKLISRGTNGRCSLFVLYAITEVLSTLANWPCKQTRNAMYDVSLYIWTNNKPASE